VTVTTGRPCDRESRKGEDPRAGCREGNQDLDTKSTVPDKRHKPVIDHVDTVLSTWALLLGNVTGPGGGHVIAT
jgi:hypothetical protein